MNKLSDFLKPESMLTGNFVGGSIAGIGAAFGQYFPHWPNGYIVLAAASLFGILMASQTVEARRGKLIFAVYLLLGTGLGMWEAVQSGTFIESKIEVVRASSNDQAIIDDLILDEPISEGLVEEEVYVDRYGHYVAVKQTSFGTETHRAPSWAVAMYCDYVAGAPPPRERMKTQKQSPWQIKF